MYVGATTLLLKSKRCLYWVSFIHFHLQPHRRKCQESTFKRIRPLTNLLYPTGWERFKRAIEEVWPTLVLWNRLEMQTIKKKHDFTIQHTKDNSKECNEWFPRLLNLQHCKHWWSTDLSQFLINNDVLVWGTNIQDRKCKIMEQKKETMSRIVNRGKAM